jgi:PIN domain nuclease of toxin-antitoxin system
MKLLLDTHTFIWWDGSPQQLGPQAKPACFESANELVLSVASVWEMQIKVMLGKLTLRKPLRQLVTDQVQQNGLIVLPVNLEHTLRLDSLPSHHKDPFDRLIVAQALVEGWPVVSHDPAVAQYPVTVIW